MYICIYFRPLLEFLSFFFFSLVVFFGKSTIVLGVKGLNKAVLSSCGSEMGSERSCCSQASIWIPSDRMVILSSSRRDAFMHFISWTRGIRMLVLSMGECYLHKGTQCPCRWTAGTSKASKQSHVLKTQLCNCATIIKVHAMHAECALVT